MPEQLPLLYCTEDDVHSIFSRMGVVWRVDDDQDGEQSNDERELLDDAIREATDIINGYAMHFYTADTLFTSRIVTRWAAWITCYLISRRRGNPGQFADEYASIIEELTLVSKQLKWIPRLKTRSNFTPTVSNYKLTRDRDGCCDVGPGCQTVALDECDSYGYGRSSGTQGDAFDGGFDQGLD